MSSYDKKYTRKFPSPNLYFIVVSECLVTNSFDLVFVLFDLALMCSTWCFKQIWKVGKVGKIDREGLIMPIMESAVIAR